MRARTLSNPIRALLTFFGVLLIGVGLLRSLAIAYPRGAVDFRNRVVAARQAELGLNPYVFRWDPSYPETLLDPSQEANAKYSRMTSPPTTLWAHSWFSDLDYRTQKTANFFLAWLSLLGIAAWLVYASRSLGIARRDGFPVVAVITGIVASSGIWLFHVERGQQYAYLALFLVFAAFPPASRRNAWPRRIFTALSAYFRFTLGPVAFLSFREKTPIRDLAWIALLGALFFVPVLAKYPIDWWADYFASSRDWYFRRFGLHEKLPALVFAPPSAPEGDPTLPTLVNFGVPGNVLYHAIGKLGLRVVPYTAGMLATLVGTAAFGIVLWRARREALLVYALRFFAGIYLVDHLLPAPRSGYNAVLFYPGLVLGALLAFLTKGRDAKERDWNWCIGAPLAVGFAYSLWSLWNPLSSPYGVETFYLFAALLALFQPIRRGRSAGTKA